MGKNTATKDNDDQHRWRVRMLVLHGAMLAVPMALLVAHARFQFNRPGTCALKAMFGVECPACGITRAVMALFTGDIMQALRFHPTAPLIVLLITLMVTYLIVVVFTKVRGLEWRKEVKVYTGIEVLALTALLIGWVERMIMN